MITELEIQIETKSPEKSELEIISSLAEAGHQIGEIKYGSSWESQISPSEEKLRIWKPYRLSGKNLELSDMSYPWSDLQAQRQLHPIGDYRDDSPIKYLLNALVLSANALIETSDGKLVFHYKKKGAKEGSIHTFGGYVGSEDIKYGGIRSTIKRELGEEEELGLNPEEIEVTKLFGTPEGKPSILWKFGTCAIYGLANISLSSNELQKRIYKVPGSESIDKKLVFIPKSNLEGLNDLYKEGRIHPQTAQVIPTIYELYNYKMEGKLV